MKVADMVRIPNGVIVTWRETGWSFLPRDKVIENRERASQDFKAGYEIGKPPGSVVYEHLDDFHTQFINKQQAEEPKP